MEVPTDLALAEDDPPPRRLEIAAFTSGAMARSSMTILEVQGEFWRVEFWSDRAWATIPEDARPAASRAHSDDGWFDITRLPGFSRPRHPG